MSYLLRNANFAQTPLRNAVLDKRPSDPEHAVEGQLVYNTTDKVFKLYKDDAWHSVAITPSESWITPTLGSSWVNYDEVNESVAGYYKDAMGVVHLKGTIKGGLASSTIWNLPAGYRPAERQWFGTSINNSFSYVAVYTNGNIIPMVAGGTGRTILNGISFRAAGT